MKNSFVSLAPLTAFAIAAVMMAVTSAGAQTPYFEARFNEAGDMDLQNGATLAAGVSGQPADRSYSADTAHVTTSEKTPVALTSTHDPAMGIEEFTVTVWYKARETPANDTTLFDAVGTVLIWEEKANQWILRVDAKPAAGVKPTAYWFRSGENAALGGWTAPGQWNFLALVWKKSDKKVLFYQGGTTTPATLVQESGRPEAVESLNERSDGKRAVGNTVSGKARPFNGEIDDYRFYKKALSADAVEKIRRADLVNQAPALP